MVFVVLWLTCPAYGGIGTVQPSGRALPFAATWPELEGIMLGDAGHSAIASTFSVPVGAWPLGVSSSVDTGENIIYNIQSQVSLPAVTLRKGSGVSVTFFTVSYF